MKPMRGSLFGLVLILTSRLLAPSQTAAGRQATELAITIGVKNYAKVDTVTLAEAEGVATQIFRKAGVEARWVDVALTPEDQQKASTDIQPFTSQIQLFIIPSTTAKRLGLPNNAMGLAPGTDRDRRLVYVFSNSVEALAQRQMRARIKGTVLRNANEAQILGHVITHEIGHELLNLKSHSATGIMRGEWDLKDLQDATYGYLLFTSPQAEVIRAEVARRTKQQEALKVAGLESQVQAIPGIIASK